MTRDLTTVADLIALWGSAEQFAREVGLKRPEHARTMRIRGTINERWHDAIVLAASRRGIDGVTHPVLARINANHAARLRRNASSIQAEASVAA
jgi:hypothetical protein